MFKLVVIAALCVIRVASDPPRCCWSSEYVAGNGGTVGQELSSGAQGYFTYLYGASDFAKRRFGFNMTVSYPDRHEELLRIIQEYSMGTQYIINDQLRTCSKQPATQPEPFRCIPDDAKYLSSFRTGGPNGLVEESWRIRFEKPTDPIQGTIVFNVARLNATFCYPVSSSFLGDRNQGAEQVPLVATSGIFNITEGIVNPDKWFTLPDFCNNASLSNGIRTRGQRDVPQLDFFHLPKLF